MTVLYAICAMCCTRYDRSLWHYCSLSSAIGPVQAQARAVQPFRCPVCEGRGNVPAGFYERGYAGSTNPSVCRTCRGSGIV